MMELTHEEVASLITSCPESGRLYWRSDSGIGFKKSVIKHRAGDEAGTPRPDGRVVVRLKGKLYLRYRLIWLLSTGCWPEAEIDHINGVSSDDRLANLRCVVRRVNQQNIRRSTTGKKSSSHLGTYLDKRKTGKKWRAAITLNGKQISLGYFHTEAEAASAYVNAKRRIHEGCTI